MIPYFLTDIPVSTTLNAGSALLFGIVSGLVIAAFYWYVYTQDAEIFWSNAYRCGIAGSAIFGAGIGLLLFYDWSHKTAVLPLALIILLWNSCIIYVCRKNNNPACRGLLTNRRLWHLFGLSGGIVLLSCIILRLCLN